MREHFEAAWIDEAEYAHFIDLVTLPDPDDRHVVAAAIGGRADYIVTDNLKHFPEAELARFNLEVGSADKFLAGTFDHYPTRSLRTLASHRQGLKSKPSPSEYVMQLQRYHLSHLSSRIKPYKDMI